MQQWKEKGHRTCPACRVEFISIDACVNLALKNVCDGIVQASLGSEDICSLHKETLKLFCLDHQELVCNVCLHAKSHAGHEFRPLEDVVEGHKEDLKKGLQDAKERLTYSRKMKDDCSEQAACLKVQREQVEGKIRKDFEEFRLFLQFEEEAKLSAVREEEQKKSRMMKEKMEDFDRDVATLSDVIRTTEEHLRSEGVSFLKNIRSVMTRIRELPAKPELLPATLLD